MSDKIRFLSISIPKNKCYNVHQNWYICENWLSSPKKKSIKPIGMKKKPSREISVNNNYPNIHYATNYKNKQDAEGTQNMSEICLLVTLN